MDICKALEIIELLADGIDPYTGEVFPVHSPYQHPDTVRALFEAVRALERRPERSKSQEALPENAGKPWTQEEDELLVKQFDGGMSVRELSLEHKRTEGAMRSRLMKLGKIPIVNMSHNV